MTFDDFYRLEMCEFRACCRAYNEMREADMHADWERMRMLATIVIQPHVKGKVTPERLLPLPWEKKARRRRAAQKPMDRDEQRERFRMLVGKG